MSYLEELRKRGLLRPAQEHDNGECWRNEPKDYDWRGTQNPAIAPKSPKPALKPAETKTKASKSTEKLCKSCGIYPPGEKSIYCPECRAAISHQQHENKKAYYRARGKAQRAAEKAKQDQPVKVCRVCGQPALKKQALCAKHFSERRKERLKEQAPKVCKICGEPQAPGSTNLLCRKHKRELSKRTSQAEKLNKETEKIKAVSQEKRAALLAEKWSAIQEEYRNGTR